MEFPFGRQTSKEALLNKAGESSRAFKSSITSGSSRLFGSVMSKKNGIFDGISSGISNTFDQVMTITGQKDEQEEEVEEATPNVKPPPTKKSPSPSASSAPVAPPAKPERRNQETTPQPQQGPRSESSKSASTKSPPPKPPQPQRSSSVSGPPRPPPARPNRPPPPGTRGRANGSTRGQPGPGRLSRQQTAPADIDPMDGMPDISLDAPMYGYHYRSGSVDMDQDSGFQDTASNFCGSNNSPNAPDMTGSRISKNPFLNDPMPDPDHEFNTMLTKAVVHSDVKVNQPSDYGSNLFSDLDPITRMKHPGQKSSLGVDLLPGIPRVPSNNTALLAPQAQGRDLLAITPTSGEALPMPSIEPTHSHTRDPDEIYDDSDGDSEATEGCDEEPDPEDYGGDDYDYADEAPVFRSGSVGSEQSWHSNQSTDSQLDDISRASRDFMKEFCFKIFSTNEDPSQADKADFGRCCQNSAGRLWFARYVNAQRVSSKKVDERVFYSLIQYFAVCLFECNEAEDFGPAKTLMNMCFTFYLEVQPPSGPPLKHFLYSYLKDQPIWQSIRFWNAAFFDAVQHERARKPTPTRGTGREGQMDDRQYQENITFGQLGTFTCNMRAFGLRKDMCLEFLRKQATIANLRDEQISMLRENIDR